MNDEELRRKLKQLKIEDFVWVIYIGIIAISWYANDLERKYFIYNDLKSKEEYRSLLMLIFSILIVVYLYFLKDSYDDLRNLSESDSDEKKFLTLLSFIASLLIAISGFIFLYIVFKDKDINIELAFN